jgi:hypothetical protein
MAAGPAANVLTTTASAPSERLFVPSADAPFALHDKDGNSTEDFAPLMNVVPDYCELASTYSNALNVIW